MSVLDEELDDLEDDLDDSEDLVGPQANLPVDAGAAFKALLDKAESRIDRILDPNHNPSLAPPDAGSTDTSVNPSTLAESAQTCHQLAVEAQTEIGKTTPDHGEIGTKLKTIKHLLPAYRQQAGIT